MAQVKSERELLLRLYWALSLAKEDAERDGAKYGPQSTVNKTLKAVAKYLNSTSDKHED